MLGFSKNKAKSESLKTLNEKEIQARLYGQYRGDLKIKSPVLPEKKQTNNNSTGFALPRAVPSTASKSVAIETPKPIGRPPLGKPTSQASGFSYPPSIRKSPGLSRRFQTWLLANLRLAALIGICAVGITSIALAALVFRDRFPQSLKRGATPSASDQIQANQSAEQPASTQLSGSVAARDAESAQKLASKASAGQVKPAAGGTRQTDDTPPSAKPPTAAHSFYSVQICTYYTEDDAKRLVEKMRGLGLSGFYQSVPNRSGSQQLFYVMLGRDVNYFDAQARLEQFKKMPIAEDFRDAYVRKLTSS